MVDPVSGKPLDTSQLIKLNFFKVYRHLPELQRVLMTERRRNDARPNHLQSLFTPHPYRLPKEYRKSPL